MFCDVPIQDKLHDMKTDTTPHYFTLYTIRFSVLSLTASSLLRGLGSKSGGNSASSTPAKRLSGTGVSP